jgi:hypothetical protein
MKTVLAGGPDCPSIAAAEAEETAGLHLGLSCACGTPLVELSKPAAVADVLGDWREEIITSVPGELRIYTTTIPAGHHPQDGRRRVCLIQDPLYRMDVVCATMGYYQVPMTSYDLATGKR